MTPQNGTVFWDTTPCIPFKVNRRFGATYHLRFQGQSISQERHPRQSSVSHLTLVSCSAYSSMEAICSSETTVDFQRTTERYIAEDSTTDSHHCEDLRSYTVIVPFGNNIPYGHCSSRIVSFISTLRPRLPSFYIEYESEFEFSDDFLLYNGWSYFYDVLGFHINGLRSVALCRREGEARSGWSQSTFPIMLFIYGHTELQCSNDNCKRFRLVQ
jgi:hypothetical protein